MEPFNVVNVPLQKGATLIEASAGTGKTYSIAALFLRLVLEEDASVQSILAVTYTTAATQELRERVRARLHTALVELQSGEASDPIVVKYRESDRDLAAGIRALELAVRSFDEARIFTIHGFCHRVLQEHAFESGMRTDAELITDSKPLLEEVAQDFWRSRFYASPALLAALALAHGASPEGWVELLERTRNHPDLVILPEAEGHTCDEIAKELALAFSAVREEWIRSRAEIEAILISDNALLRGEKTFRADRLGRLLSALQKWEYEPLEIDEPIIEAISAFCTPAIVAATGKNKTAPTHRFFERCETFCFQARAFFNQLTHEFLAYAKAELPSRKLHRNVLTYDDLLTQVHRALQSPNGQLLATAIGSKYCAALIDEFQDTDPLQYAIFQRIFGTERHWLFFIGDPKQAIYGFRGADVFTYLSAAQSAERQYTLETNWRSDQALLDGFNAFFTRHNDPFVVEHIHYYPVHSPCAVISEAQDPALRFRYLRCEEAKGFNQETAARRLAEGTAADIARLHISTGGPWQWGQLAVLVRTHRQASIVEAALRQRGIRSVLHTEESVFHSRESGELQRMMAAALAPGDNALLHAALSTPLLALSGNEIAALTPAAHQQWVERFAAWRDVWRNVGFSAMFCRWLTEQDLRRCLMEQPGGERSLTNILHLAELLHKAANAQRFTPEALLEWLAQEQASRRSASDAAQLRLESDGDAVQLVTVHKSKGLEYDVVLCPFLWSPADTIRRENVQFHDRNGHLTFDLRGKSGAAAEDISQHSMEALAEEVRLLYVAVTRAKHGCFIYGGAIQNARASALGHLLGGDLLDGMEALASGHPASIALTFIEPEGQPNMPEAEQETAPQLAARRFPGAIHSPAFLTSFTGLTAGTSREERERDRPAEPLAISETLPNQSGYGGIFQFEKGAQAGVFFHDVLEHLDFQNPAQLETLLFDKLAAHGFSGSPHAAAIQSKLAELLEVELEPGLRLRQIPNANRLSEVEFSLPLPSLRPEDLRSIFVEEGEPALDPNELGRLRFSPVEGFLRGFIDLLFLHQGRYYLVDWKSNWLGNRPEDYDAAGVQTAMREHHYALQAHLYVLAADRFLAARLPGYDYERHFGGFYYLFLRGIERDTPGRGIFHGRPTLAVVEKLRALTQPCRP